MTREHHPHDHNTHHDGDPMHDRRYHKMVTADDATKAGWLATWKTLSDGEKQSVVNDGDPAIKGLLAALRMAGVTADEVGHVSGGGTANDPLARGFTTSETLAKFGIVV